MGDTGALSSLVQLAKIGDGSSPKSSVDARRILDVEQLDGDRTGVEQTVGGADAAAARDLRSVSRRDKDDSRV